MKWFTNIICQIKWQKNSISIMVINFQNSTVEITIWGIKTIFGKNTKRLKILPPQSKNCSPFLTSDELLKRQCHAPFVQLLDLFLLRWHLHQVLRELEKQTSQMDHYPQLQLLVFWFLDTCTIPQTQKKFLFSTMYHHWLFYNHVLCWSSHQKLFCEAYALQTRLSPPTAKWNPKYEALDPKVYWHPCPPYKQTWAPLIPENDQQAKLIGHNYI